MRILKIFSRAIDVRLFVFIVLAFAFLPFAYAAYAPVFTMGALINNTPREDYLTSLRGNPLAGCLLMRELKPDVLVLGDSHAYAGFDYPELERLVHPLRVGHCAIGAVFLETFDQWLTFFESSDYRPKHIVFGASLRMFTENPQKATRRLVVQKFLFDETFKRRQIRKWVAAGDAGLPTFGKTAELWETAINDHAPKIAQLDEKALELGIQRSNKKYFIGWHSVRNRRLILAHDETIDKICTRLRKLGIRLSVVHLPLSPRAWRAYTPDQIASYDRLLQNFEQCAQIVITSSETEGLVINRHYVNRFLAPDYDYDQWTKRRVDFGEKPNAVFDLDHLNPVGARLFTKWVFEKIDDW